MPVEDVVEGSFSQNVIKAFIKKVYGKGHYCFGL